MLPDYATTSLEFLATLFVFVIGILAAGVLVLFVLDICQTRDAIRRNYPVIGRFRGLFLKLGEFFRQYFFTLDREEMPFNRAERNWVYNAARNADATMAFGSTKNIREPGTLIFVNCPFPTLETDAAATRPLVIGPEAHFPYSAPSLFNISGMSFGAVSVPAVRALSKGAKMADCWLNTGEGGLSPHHLEGECDIVFQIGTAKYGVRDAEGRISDAKLKEIAAHDTVRMFEIKLSQGAKPGKGGILPAAKVTEEIARIRGIPAGRDSISPNRHPEIDTVGELLDMIDRVRGVTGKPTGFKCVIGAYGWLDALFEEIRRRGTAAAPDFITVDSADGGTGAAPMALMDNVGLPIRESLPQLVNLLWKHGLKERVRVIASGKLVLPSEVAWAVCAGADFVTSARGFMFSLGCIQAMRCNRNTCPTGVTTHNPRLQRGLNPDRKALAVSQYCRNMARDVEIIAHSCGVPEPRRLKRFHVRIVTDGGHSVPMNELYPSPDPAESDPAAARAAAQAQNAAAATAAVPGQH